MTECPQQNKLDELDLAILRELQVDGRISKAELARRYHLSPPAIHGRINQLEEKGYIRQYVTVLDREKLGYDLLCLISITTQVHQFEEVEQVRARVAALPEVLECHHVTGEFDYVLKVVVRNRKELEGFVVNRLTPIPGISRIHTCLVLAEVKSSAALPLA